MEDRITFSQETSKVELEKLLNKEFNSKLAKIGKYLDIEPLEKSFIIEIEREDSDLDIIYDGKQFAVHLEKKKIIFGKKLLTIQKRVFSSFLHFILSREAFRVYFYQLTNAPAKYKDLIDVALNLIVTIWFIRDQNIQLLENPHINIIRSSQLFEDDEYLRQQDWDTFLYFCYIYKKDPLKIFEKLVDYTEQGKTNNWSKRKYIEEFQEWLTQITKIQDFTGLPLCLDERHYEIATLIQRLGKKESSARKIGSYLGLKHDVIHTDFKIMYEKYNCYWGTTINPFQLKLYPYFLRVTLAKHEKAQVVIKALSDIPYLRNLFIGNARSNGNTRAKVISGYSFLPHIVYDQLENLFRKLQAEKTIEDYFCKMIRRRTFYSAISKKEFDPSAKLIRDMLGKPLNYDYSKLVVLDEEYDLLQEPKLKKARFKHDVLEFLSLIRASYLTKAYYMSYVIELEKFAKRLGVDSQSSIAKLINRFEKRCLRLDVLKYYFNIHNFYRHKLLLNIEIDSKANKKIIEEIKEKFRIASNVIYLEFNDKSLFCFPNIRLANIFVDATEELLAKMKVDYKLYLGELIPELDRYIPYHELYDYELERWKF